MNPDGSLTAHQSHVLRQSYLELLTLSGRLRDGVPPAKIAELRNIASDQLRLARRQLLGAGIDEEVVHDVQLPVIALLDESANACGEQWSKFGIEILRDVDLGVLVFDRLQKLQDSPRTPVEVLEIYARCLTFGLKGKYEALGRPQELRVVCRDLQDRIETRLPVPPLCEEFGMYVAPPPVMPLLDPVWVAGIALVVLAAIGLGSCVKMRGLVQQSAAEIRDPEKYGEK